jgi:hypothetical protein
MLIVFEQQSFNKCARYEELFQATVSQAVESAFGTWHLRGTDGPCGELMKAGSLQLGLQFF